MKEQEALTLVDALLHSANQRQRLNDTHSLVVLETRKGRSYRETAQQLGYDRDYIKKASSQLCKVFADLSVIRSKYLDKSTIGQDSWR